MEVDIFQCFYEIWSHMLHICHLVVGLFFLLALLEDRLYLMIVMTASSLSTSSDFICILFYHT